MKEQLTKKFGFLATASMVVGIMIGIGIYFRVGGLMRITQANPLIGLFAWIFGAIITMLAGLCFAEMASNYTTTGGDITFMHYAAGDVAAFMFGWSYVLLGKPALTAIFAWVGADFFTSAFSLDAKIWDLPVALIFVIVVFGINIIRPKGGGKAQVLLTAIKIIPLALLIFFGLFAGHGQLHQVFDPIKLTPGSNLVLIFFAALIPVVFTYDGYISSATASTEIENPQKNLPKALICGISFVAVIYISVYLGILNVFPAETLKKAVPFGVAKELFGGIGSQIIMIGITISALGALNGLSISAIRVPYSLGIRKMIIFSDQFAKVNSTTNSPILSGIVMTIITLFYVFCNYFGGDGGDFSGIASATTFLWYILIYVGMINLRRTGKLRTDGFRTPMFPLIPILASLTSLTLAIGLFFIDHATTRNTLISFAIFLSGLPIYFIAKRQYKGELGGSAVE